ncbi:uncharacterized protein LOC106157196 [Lingula anatina]|uniref:Uncharacterized protein LOC106157196 n=1 Tax=Lingula anatina TaxID=7574 RepID=A0A1S3HQB4_LINAN|nr:uncharacterized protein LOC106157196 [Lingula anatina]|eukprot:XP_013388225.1 uncharacterized protein LOC106157196 [Lingula anatina]
MMTKCCFCWSLHRGTLACCFYTLFCSLGSLVYYCYIATLTSMAVTGGYYTECGTFFGGNFILSDAISYISVPLHLLWLLASLVALCGAGKSRTRWMLVPWMVFTIVECLYYIVCIVLYYICGMDTVFLPNLSSYIWVPVVLNIAFFVINVYALICVGSYHHLFGYTDDLDSADGYSNHITGSRSTSGGGGGFSLEAPTIYSSKYPELPEEKRKIKLKKGSESTV